MIGFIKGILRDKDYDNITVECNGVGFNLMVTNSCMASLPLVDEEVKIYTYLHVREDEMSLYGFVSPEEKKLFLQLISVSGVGSKTAIQILSCERMSAIINSIINEDVSVIAGCKGIGKKTAERIILELKDKIKPFDYIIPNDNTGSFALVRRVNGKRLNKFAKNHHQIAESARIRNMINQKTK